MLWSFWHIALYFICSFQIRMGVTCYEGRKATWLWWFCDMNGSEVMVREDRSMESSGWTEKLSVNNLTNLQNYLPSNKSIQYKNKTKATYLLVKIQQDLKRSSFFVKFESRSVVFTSSRNLQAVKMRCCVDLVKFFLFIFNFLCFVSSSHWTNPRDVNITFLFSLDSALCLGEASTSCSMARTPS